MTLKLSVRQLNPADTGPNRERSRDQHRPAPLIPCLAFGDNRRRRSFALAVVASVLRTAGDAQESEHHSHCKLSFFMMILPLA